MFTESALNGLEIFLDFGLPLLKYESVVTNRLWETWYMLWSLENIGECRSRWSPKYYSFLLMLRMTMRQQGMLGYGGAMHQNFVYSGRHLYLAVAIHFKVSNIKFRSTRINSKMSENLFIKDRSIPVIAQDTSGFAKSLRLLLLIFEFPRPAFGISIISSSFLWTSFEFLAF